jgi:hypothetical protein
MDEFSAAMMTAVKQGDGYVLPVLIGDVQDFFATEDST